MTETRAPRVALVAHTTLFAEAVSRSLESAGIPVTSAAEATVIVVEAEATIAATVATLRRIQQASPLPAVVIGMEAGEAELVELIEAGCCGCVRSDATLADLLGAIQNVCCGRVACSPYLAALVSARIRELSHDLTGSAETPALTAREIQVLRLAARGLSNKEIAQQLRIWVETVKTHLHNVYARLGVRTRRAAMAKALRLGLIRDSTHGGTTHDRSE
jgi:DNA-binding NarL/FixJ family response regulator